MYKVIGGDIDLRCNDFGNQRNNIFRGVLLSGRFCRYVGPFAFDMLLESGYFRVVVVRKIYLRPLGDILHQNTFLPQLGNHAVQIEVFAVVGTTLDTEQFFECSVKACQIASEILLKCLVVIANGGQCFAFANNVVVISTLTVSERFDKFLQVVLAGQALGGFNICHFISHTPFEHDESEEWHHVIRKFALLDSR